MYRLPAARRGRRGAGPGPQPRPGLPARSVRQRPPLRRLVVPERRHRPGVRLGPARPVQGPAGVGHDPDPARSPARRAAGAGRRGVPAGGVRAARVRGRGRPPPARRAVPRVGRESVLLGHDPADGHAVGVADPPVRPGPGVRRQEALLRRRRRDGEVAGEGRGVAGPTPGEGRDRPPLPGEPAEPVPDGPQPPRR